MCNIHLLHRFSRPIVWCSELVNPTTDWPATNQLTQPPSDLLAWGLNHPWTTDLIVCSFARRPNWSPIILASPGVPIWPVNLPIQNQLIAEYISDWFSWVISAPIKPTSPSSIRLNSHWLRSAVNSSVDRRACCSLTILHHRDSCSSACPRPARRNIRPATIGPKGSASLIRLYIYIYAYLKMCA